MFIYSSTCFGRFPAHYQELNDCSGSLWFYLRIVVTAVMFSWSGRPAWPWKHHDCHHNTKVKPEAATAVVELLMMGGETAETCWAVNKRQDNKLKICCIRLVIYWIKCKNPVPKFNQHSVGLYRSLTFRRTVGLSTLELLYKFHIVPTVHFGTTVTRGLLVHFSCNIHWRSAQGKLTVVDGCTLFTPHGLAAVQRSLFCF